MILAKRRSGPAGLERRVKPPAIHENIENSLENPMVSNPWFSRALTSFGPASFEAPMRKFSTV